MRSRNGESRALILEALSLPDRYKVAGTTLLTVVDMTHFPVQSRYYGILYYPCGRSVGLFP
jgi:hypothetical protein